MKSTVKGLEVLFQSSMRVQIERGPHIPCYLRYRDTFTIQFHVLILEMMHDLSPSRRPRQTEKDFFLCRRRQRKRNLPSGGGKNKPSFLSLGNRRHRGLISLCPYLQRSRSILSHPWNRSLAPHLAEQACPPSRACSLRRGGRVARPNCRRLSAVNKFEGPILRPL